jgi:Jacalin-like lectin domain
MPGHHSRSPSPRRRHSRSPSPGRRHSPGPHHHKHSPPPSPGRHHHEHGPPHHEHGPGPHGPGRHEHERPSEETEASTQKYEAPPSKATYTEPVAAATAAVSQMSMAQSQPTEATSQKKSMTWTKSKKFGGDGGAAFDHGNFESIAKISIKHDGHAVKYIAATYPGGKRIGNGSDEGDVVELNFNQGEYVNKVTVRANKLIQCLTFETNQGRKLGPAGGEGWKLLKDRKGEEETITAPEGYKLCGFSGSYGDYVDALAFNWGTI